MRMSIPDNKYQLFTLVRRLSSRNSPNMLEKRGQIFRVKRSSQGFVGLPADAQGFHQGFWESLRNSVGFSIRVSSERVFASLFLQGKVFGSISLHQISSNVHFFLLKCMIFALSLKLLHRTDFLFWGFLRIHRRCSRISRITRIIGALKIFLEISKKQEVSRDSGVLLIHRNLLGDPHFPGSAWQAPYHLLLYNFFPRNTGFCGYQRVHQGLYRVHGALNDLTRSLELRSRDRVTYIWLEARDICRNNISGNFSIFTCNTLSHRVSLKEFDFFI